MQSKIMNLISLSLYHPLPLLRDRERKTKGRDQAHVHVIRVTVVTFVTRARWVIIWKKIKRVAEVREREREVNFFIINRV